MPGGLIRCARAGALVALVAALLAPALCTNAASASAGLAWSAPRQIYPLTRLPGSKVFGRVSCASIVFCVALELHASRAGKENATGSRAFVYNGSGWSGPTTLDPDGGLLDISCVAGSFCAAVDLHGNALTSAGAKWSAPKKIDPYGRLQGVSCVTASFCVAVDSRGDAVRFNGTGWSAPKAIYRHGELGPVSCASDSFCVAITAHGEVLSFNGTR